MAVTFKKTHEINKRLKMYTETVKNGMLTVPWGKKPFTIAILVYPTLRVFTKIHLKLPTTSRYILSFEK